MAKNQLPPATDIEVLKPVYVSNRDTDVSIILQSYSAEQVAQLYNTLYATYKAKGCLPKDFSFRIDRANQNAIVFTGNDTSDHSVRAIASALLITEGIIEDRNRVASPEDIRNTRTDDTIMSRIQEAHTKTQKANHEDTKKTPQDEGLIETVIKAFKQFMR